jgi:DNA-directed RNA polymerase subunit beta'
VIDLHAKIKVRLPKHRKLKDSKTTSSPTGWRSSIPPTVALLFNMMLPQGMDFYNSSLEVGDLAAVISDCYQRLGRRATIDLLDDMNQLGFREALAAVCRSPPTTL